MAIGILTDEEFAAEKKKLLARSKKGFSGQVPGDGSAGAINLEAGLSVPQDMRSAADNPQD